MQRTFKARGRGPFPISMLRFDQCWPATDVDATAIERSFEPRTGPWEVTLYSASRSAPTVGRWNSFNCAAEEDRGF